MSESVLILLAPRRSQAWAWAGVAWRAARAGSDDRDREGAGFGDGRSRNSAAGSHVRNLVATAAVTDAMFR